MGLIARTPGTMVTATAGVPELLRAPASPPGRTKRLGTAPSSHDARRHLPCPPESASDVPLTGYGSESSSQPDAGRLTNRSGFLERALLSRTESGGFGVTRGLCLGSQEPLSTASFTMEGLVPDLQHILFWMSNSVELLYFIQQKCPLYMQSLEEELDATGMAVPLLPGGSKESLFSCTLTASEEAMAVLEEVVLYAFQQCVYYVSKVRPLRARSPGGPECRPGRLCPPGPRPRALSLLTRCCSRRASPLPQRGAGERERRGRLLWGGDSDGGTAVRWCRLPWPLAPLPAPSRTLVGAAVRPHLGTQSRAGHHGALPCPWVSGPLFGGSPAPLCPSLYVCLPALLECPPFQLECRESWCSAPRLPEELHRIVSVYQATLDLLRPLQVHPEIAAQVLAYLFFFSGTLLFNQLLDKGPSLSCFHWPRGVQACARLQQLLEWTRSAGFGEAGERFFRKLSCTLNLLATPSAQLVQPVRPVLDVRPPELYDCTRVDLTATFMVICYNSSRKQRHQLTRLPHLLYDMVVTAPRGAVTGLARWAGHPAQCLLASPGNAPPPPDPALTLDVHRHGMSWANLRAAFPALSPAQLHRLLTQYQLASAMGPMSAWEPGAQDSPAAFKSGQRSPLPLTGPRRLHGHQEESRVSTPGAMAQPVGKRC
ncbi:hypothetical protein J1605_019505 [Eschrichtius robustus]|uniref:Dilute domain-containing protein n=1 Tax=Eschrichtius robustus TaxID=9764 RepID=A0AB34HNQ1_ESCRO|nr:hypothetical protein J1605_019505 [Eschrichtius robustus]